MEYTYVYVCGNCGKGTTVKVKQRWSRREKVAPKGWVARKGKPSLCPRCSNA